VRKTHHQQSGLVRFTHPTIANKGDDVMTVANRLATTLRFIVRLVVFLAFGVGVVVLLLWLAGYFTPKVPAKLVTESSAASKIEGRIVPVRVLQVPITESAVGTIRAVHETSIGSKLLARVMEVDLKAGEKVKKGDVLIRLDDSDLLAKLQQVKAAVSSAEAVRAQAASDERRYAELVQSRTVSRQQYDSAIATLHSADADLLRAKAAVNEVQATLDWATIRSPIDGTVIDKKVDVGDMVTPGQMLVTLYDPKRMQLVASVRESLTHRLQVGQDIGVRVEGLDKQCSGTISEIVPEAQSASRTFQVKVTGPCPVGIYSGMFGRILIPLDEEKVLVIPRAAVREVGQLNLVEVVENNEPTRRAIRIGRAFGDDVEVLSGLREGEEVVAP
jgi:RND family efflux transporter MFP subunit